MKILQLANKFPYPAKDGGSIATLSMSTTFASLGNETSILAMNTSKHYFPLEDLPESLSGTVEFFATPVNTSISPVKLLQNFLFSRKPYNAIRFISPDFEKRLEALLQEHTYDIIQLEGATTSAVLIALDRQEKGQGELSAIQEVHRDYGIEVFSIITMADLIDYLAGESSFGQHLAAMEDYRSQYGV